MCRRVGRREGVYMCTRICFGKDCWMFVVVACSYVHNSITVQHQALFLYYSLMSINKRWCCWCCRWWKVIVQMMRKTATYLQTPEWRHTQPEDYIGRRGEGTEVYILISSYGNFGGMTFWAKLSSFRFQNIFPLKSFYEALCRPSLCFSLMLFCADGNR